MKKTNRINLALQKEIGKILDEQCVSWVFATKKTNNIKVGSISKKDIQECKDAGIQKIISISKNRQVITVKLKNQKTAYIFGLNFSEHCHYNCNISTDERIGILNSILEFCNED